MSPRPAQSGFGFTTGRDVGRNPWTRLLNVLNRCVDHPLGRDSPPLANYIPDSNGHGGRVIASGHP